ncbi:MAG: hypothetical protein H7Z75_19500 [Ferruginibacter sp.]|nr:hypothetical protein [Cytophagales bacterium]
MRTRERYPRISWLSAVRLVVYGLPFAGFYAVGGLVETLKRPLPLDRQMRVWEAWLHQNNPDHATQCLILLAMLAFWGLTWAALRRAAFRFPQRWAAFRFQLPRRYAARDSTHGEKIAR